MKTNIKRNMNVVITFILGCLMIAAAIAFKLVTLNSALAAPNAYPAPNNSIIGGKNSTSTPIGICEKVYSDIYVLPPGEKRDALLQQYQDCQESLNASNQSSKSQKIAETPIPNKPILENLTRKLSGSGIIVNGLVSKISPTLFFQTNAWYTMQNNRFIYIFGGAKREKSSDISHSAILVDVTDVNGISLPGGGLYSAPFNAGPISIIDATNDSIILSSENGTTFYFDFNSMKFITPQGIPANQKAELNADNGKIVFDDKVIQNQTSYIISSYWFGEYQGNTIYVIVGRENKENGKGVIAVVNSTTLPFSFEKADIYLIPQSQTSSFNYVRIFDVNNHQITIVGRWGETFIFDLAQRRFLTLEEIQKIPTDPQLLALELNYQKVIKDFQVVTPTIIISTTNPAYP